jgi:hypothetical protein
VQDEVAAPVQKLEKAKENVKIAKKNIKVRAEPA